MEEDMISHAVNDVTVFVRSEGDDNVKDLQIKDLKDAFRSAGAGETQVIVYKTTGDLKDGLSKVTGRYVLEIDIGDVKYTSMFIELWKGRGDAGIVIGSRPGRGREPVYLKIIKWLMALPVSDITSRIRIYRLDAFSAVIKSAEKYETCLSLAGIVIGYCEGYDIKEISLSKSCDQFPSPVPLPSFGDLRNLTAVRNSAFSADYDHRAFDSIIPIQRYWQRKRFSIINELSSKDGMTLDIGCGSSRIIQARPGDIGMDISLKKLRFVRSRGHRRLVQAGVTDLPFKDRSFDEIICSQVIEHVPKDSFRIGEFKRVLKPGGTLILGTPDYGALQWNIIEFGYKMIMPHAYADDHITHYTKDGLIKFLKENGFEIKLCRYLLGAELIIKAKKKSL